MKYRYLIFVLFMFGVCMSCKQIEDENHHNHISFYNGSMSDIYVDFDIKYPDTTVTEMGILQEPDIYKIHAHSSNEEALSLATHDTFEAFFNGPNGKKFIPGDTLMVFVFDAEKLERRDLHIRNSVLVRYDLSLKDLQRLNWTLSYPPTENMKQIKMWLNPDNM